MINQVKRVQIESTLFFVLSPTPPISYTIYSYL
nr:MAG TPA: hypothetical protein [Caudoviricetes sp.]